MCSSLQKATATQENRPTKALLIFLQCVKEEVWKWVLVLQPNLNTSFCRKGNTALPRLMIYFFYLNDDLICSISCLSVHEGPKLSMASVLGTLHSCTVTSAAVLLLALSLSVHSQDD